MIPQIESLRHDQPPHGPLSTCSHQSDSESWQSALANVITEPKELFDLLQLDKVDLPAALEATSTFPLRVPRCFINRMRKGDWDDPLLRQILPVAAETDYQPGFSDDPLHEGASNPVPGIIHKYHGRVLLVISGGCAVHCRYCFRRHFPYHDNNPSLEQWLKILDYLRNDTSIHEVIFSGGDPLVASDKMLSRLVSNIAEIAHITTLRLHSRLPVVIPQRITSGCLHWLTNSRLKPVMVIHCNHANEIDEEVGDALKRLKTAGVIVLNQAVLLAGVNDDNGALAKLSERLFHYGVLPYYLHILDRVNGAAHFEVEESQAKQLISDLLARLPGYLVPKLVQELPGASSKLPIHPFS